jgi:hypothetical protein
MEKNGSIAPGRTPDVENRLTKTAATASKAQQIKQLDNDPTKRLADKAAQK